MRICPRKKEHKCVKEWAAGDREAEKAAEAEDKIENSKKIINEVKKWTG